jgi:hypothetical protein
MTKLSTERLNLIKNKVRNQPLSTSSSTPSILLSIPQLILTPPGSHSHKPRPPRQSRNNLPPILSPCTRLRPTLPLLGGSPLRWCSRSSRRSQRRANASRQVRRRTWSRIRKFHLDGTFQWEDGEWRVGECEFGGSRCCGV